LLTLNWTLNALNFFVEKSCKLRHPKLACGSN